MTIKATSFLPDVDEEKLPLTLALFHELQFKVVKIKPKGGGWYENEGDCDPNEYRAQFRARRRDVLTKRRREKDAAEGDWPGLDWPAKLAQGPALLPQGGSRCLTITGRGPSAGETNCAAGLAILRLSHLPTPCTPHASLSRSQCSGLRPADSA